MLNRINDMVFTKERTKNDENIVGLIDRMTQNILITNKDLLSANITTIKMLSNNEYELAFQVENK